MAPRELNISIEQGVHYAWLEKSSQPGRSSLLPKVPVPEGAPSKAPSGSEKPSYYGKNDPYRYALDNKLGPIEMNAIKYITRWRGKDGLKDLRKAINSIERLIQESCEGAV